MNCMKPYLIGYYLVARGSHPGMVFVSIIRSIHWMHLVIDLCLSVFPWADFRTTRGAIKLHVGLNHAGYLPEFVAITEGSTQEVNIGKLLNFPKCNHASYTRDKL